ncbi:hypothetical protein ANN_14542 [Periplaneta americana]|uniref:Uncharacterized protein n=1 Tax=Periplaneta americana TaxID=6978 RepID=A0ABQ8SWL8_PERAM|nr:hypothetical protein ANN_14542 [Periplaneta americana]
MLTEENLDDKAMDVPIPAPAACEVWSVIKFLNAQGIAPIEIDRQLCQVYGQEDVKTCIEKAAARGKRYPGKPNKRVNQFLTEHEDSSLWNFFLQELFPDSPCIQKRQTNLRANTKIVIRLCWQYGGVDHEEEEEEEDCGDDDYYYGDGGRRNSIKVGDADLFRNEEVEIRDRQGMSHQIF